MDNIKDIRKNKGLTQVQASSITGIPLRTYKVYENDPTKVGNIKYKYIVEELSRYGFVDEEHGVISVDEIKSTCKRVLDKYEVDYAILFGSYAKGEASEKSDVDILISTKIKGLRFYEIVEELREALRKKVDLLGLEQLTDNQELLNEILKDGVKVYG